MKIQNRQFARALCVACLLAPAAGAQSVYFDDSDAEILELGNTTAYAVGFRKTNGSIAYILDQATADTVSLGSNDEQLWAVQFPDDDWAYVGGDSYAAQEGATFTYEWSASSGVLELRYTADESGNLGVSAVVEVRPSEGSYLDFVIRIDNHRGVPLETFFFPRELLFSADAIEEALLPITPGVILERSFFQENRSYTANYPGWPGVFADFVSLIVQHGSFALYTLPDVTEPIPVIELGFRNNGDHIVGTTALQHNIRTYISDGQEWASPTVRLHVGQSHRAAIAAFREDSPIGGYPSIADKLGERFDAVSRSPFLNIPLQRPFSEFYAFLEVLPSPSIIHPPSYYPGGFDHNYPDFLPPDPAFGTTEDLRALFARAHELGIMAMPYTNPTWWDNDSPTILSELPPLTIDDIAVRRKDGRANIEVYGDSDGLVASPWHPFVIERCDRLVREMTEDVQVDFFFEDQVGARVGPLDFNPSSPSPLAYMDGWLEHTRKHAAVGLGTEMGSDRFLETETFLFGSTRTTMEGRGRTTEQWGDGNWRSYPFTSMTAADKVLFYQHDLDGGFMLNEWMDTGLDRLAWNLAFGFMLSYQVPEQSPSMITSWMDVAWRFQSLVASRYAGELMTDYVTLKEEVTKSLFPSLSVIRNWSESTAYDTPAHRLPPRGVMATALDGSMIAGTFTAYNGSALAGEEHYLIVERFTEGDSIRVWHPRGDDTSLRVDAQSLSSTAQLYCYGLGEDGAAYDVPCVADGSYISLAMNRGEPGAKIQRYVIATQPLYMAIPTLISPPDRAEIEPADVLLAYSPVDGATAYAVQVSVDDEFATVAAGETALALEEYAPQGLVSGTTYFWRVRSIGATADTSAWSATRSFRTAGLNVADRLVAHYAFDGNAHDAVGADDGIVSGDVTLVADRFGAADRAYSFVGADDYITLSDTGAVATIGREVTFAAWVHPESYGNGQTAVMVHDQHWYVRLENGGLVNAHVFNPMWDSPDVTSSAAAITGSWSHIAFTYDGHSMRVYAHGQLSGVTEYESTRIGTGQDSSAPRLGVGSGENWDDFHGAMDDVRIYDRALSANEISALYHGVQGRPPTPDLDGDGSVDFDDFFLFADVFGKTAADTDFDPGADLNIDGEVDFDDFFIFADAFGTPVSDER